MRWRRFSTAWHSTETARAAFRHVCLNGLTTALKLYPTQRTVSMVSGRVDGFVVPSQAHNRDFDAPIRGVQVHADRWPV